MNGGSAWRTVTVALEANVGGFVRDLNRGQQAVGTFGRSVEDSTGRASTSIRNFARGAAAIGGVALGFHAVVQAGKLMVGQAISWESAFAGVRKTVDATEEQFAALEGGIISMANRLPATREEIAGVAEAAGQLGIATPNILEFSETMIGLGEATNLSANDAATSLARLANITQMPQTEFERLGSTVVDLGNNFATTEAEIVEMGLRIAGAGSQVGLTEAQILGLATALSSVGVEAQAGGSSISRVMIDIASHVDQGGDKLERLAEIAGMTSEQFANMWRNDTAAAMTAFVQGLGEVDASGQSLFATLEELGFSEIRTRDALLRLSGAGELVADSMGVATDAWQENVALTDEVAERYATAESQLRIFANQATNVARVAGAELVPMLLAAVDGIQSLGRWAAETGSEINNRLSGAWDSFADAAESALSILQKLAEGAEPVVEVFGLIAGTGIVVVFTALAEVLEVVLGAVDALSPALYGAAAALAVVTAANVAGTVATKAHSVAMGVQLKAMYAMEAGALRLGTSMGMAKAGAAGLAAGIAMIAVQQKQWAEAGAGRAEEWVGRLREEGDLTADSFQRQAAASREFADALGETQKGGVGAYLWHRDFNAETSASIDVLLEAEKAATAAGDKLTMLGAVFELSGNQLARILTELELDPLTSDFDTLRAAIQGWADANHRGSVAAGSNTLAIEDQNEAVADAVELAMERFDAELRVVSAQQSLADAQRGVGDAHRRVAEAQRGVSDAAKGVQDAYRGVQDAARGLYDAQRGVADAQQAARDAMADLIQAQHDAVWGTKELEQANRGVEDAEKALAQAQRDSLLAQEDLDAARGRAVRNLEDLDRAARGAALSEREAELRLREAREQLADAEPEDRERSRLAVERAELALEEARVRNADAAAALEEAEAKGIEQSDEVVAAKDRITEAAEGEQAAEENLSAARERVVQVQEQLAERVEEAQRRVEEANQRVEEANYRVEQAALRVRDAHDRVGEAQQRLVDARAAVVEARDGIAEAEQRVEEAAIDAALAQYELDVKTRGASEAAKTLNENLAAVEGTLAYNSPLRSAIRGLREELNLLTENPYAVEIQTAYYLDPANTHLWEHYGGGSRRRWGGIDHYQAGGIRQAVMGKGKNMVWWDEPATGGEAYVPRLGDPNQSVPVLATAAGWYGYQLAPAGSGGGITFAEGAVAVHTGPQADPLAVGVQVSRRVAAELQASTP